MSSLFVQWKGTKVCADFTCKCGHYAHICDEGFLYSIVCGECNQAYLVPSALTLLECNREDASNPYVAIER
jgi:hypothetical protein